MLKFLLNKNNQLFFSTFKNNPFETLGISKQSNEDEIKKAYLTLAKKYHPDINPKQSQKFKEINEAYHILKDPVKRGEYMSQRHQKHDETFYQNQYQNPFKNDSNQDPFKDYYTRDSYSQNYQSHQHYYNQKMKEHHYRRNSRTHFYGSDPFEYDMDAKQREEMREQMRKQRYYFRHFSLPQLMLHLVLMLTMISFIGSMFFSYFSYSKVIEQRRREYERQMSQKYRNMHDDDDFQL